MLLGYHLNNSLHSRTRNGHIVYCKRKFRLKIRKTRRNRGIVINRPDRNREFVIDRPVQELSWKDFATYFTTNHIVNLRKHEDVDLEDVDSLALLTIIQNCSFFTDTWLS